MSTSYSRQHLKLRLVQDESAVRIYLRDELKKGNGLLLATAGTEKAARSEAEFILELLIERLINPATADQESK